MNYKQAINYLDDKINYERKNPEVYQAENVNPYRVADLLALLGNPHQKFKAIHVAGSKGKGSVSAMCAHCLQAAGLSVGLYISPHLIDLRERIRVLTHDDPDGTISPEQFAALVTAAHPHIEAVAGITWFEIITALALWHYAQRQVDIAVIEVGLGGRLDATNAISPAVTIITPISLEHTMLLGETIAEIAAEKAGIIKEKTPLICAAQLPAAWEEIYRQAQAKMAPITAIGRDFDYTPLPTPKLKSRIQLHDYAAPGSALDGVELDVGLLGAHQQENAAVAVAALQQLFPHFSSLTIDAIKKGVAETKWLGRLQLLQPPDEDLPGILLDGAHNGDSARKLAAALPQFFEYNQLWILLGITVGKDVQGILDALLPMAVGVTAVQAQHPRAMKPQQLQTIAAGFGYSVEIAESIDAGIRSLLAQASPGDLICVTGSLFVVGDLLKQWENLQSTMNKK